MLVLQMPARMAFHKGHAISQRATSAVFKLFFFVPVHLLLLWFFDTIEEQPDYAAWTAKYKCKLEITEHATQQADLKAFHPVAFIQILSSERQLNKIVDVSSYSGPDISLGHCVVQHTRVPLSNWRF